MPSEVALVLPTLVRLSILGSRVPGGIFALGWDEGERERLSCYLEGRDEPRASLVRSGHDDGCPLCGERISLALVSDGFFVWPCGLAHMVRAHGARPHHVLVRRALEASS